MLLALEPPLKWRITPLGAKRTPRRIGTALEAVTPPAKDAAASVAAEDSAKLMLFPVAPIDKAAVNVIFVVVEPSAADKFVIPDVAAPEMFDPIIAS